MIRNAWRNSVLVAALALGACAAPMPAPAPRAANAPQPPQSAPLAMASPAATLSPDVAALLAQYPSRGPAPELSNETWFNSQPLRLAELRGKVVIVEFWTYGCINCRNVLPAMQKWYETYKDQGLEIVGVHTPEFAYEAELANIQDAIGRLGVTWPVAIDNDKATWRAYANRYWPAMYLLDRRGDLRAVKIGEGQYEQTEAILRALLAEPETS